MNSYPEAAWWDACSFPPLWRSPPEDSASLHYQGIWAWGPQIQPGTVQGQPAPTFHLVPSRHAGFAVWSFCRRACWGIPPRWLAMCPGQPPASCSFTCRALDLCWHHSYAARKEEMERGHTGKERDTCQNHGRLLGLSLGPEVGS